MGPEPGADAEPGDNLRCDYARKGGGHGMGQRGEGILETGLALLGQHEPERPKVLASASVRAVPARRRVTVRRMRSSTKVGRTVPARVIKWP